MVPKHQTDFSLAQPSLFSVVMNCPSSNNLWLLGIGLTSLPHQELDGTYINTFFEDAFSDICRKRCFLYDARTPTTGSPMLLRIFHVCLLFVFILNSINVQSLLSVIFNKVKSKVQVVHQHVNICRHSKLNENMLILYYAVFYQSI